MKYFRNIIGEKCFLAPIDINDAEKYAEWLNDMEVTQYLGITDQVISLEKEKKILQGMLDRGDKIFAIIDRETGKMIGNCSIFKINWIDSLGEVGIFIGDKNFWDRGYGVEAINLLLDFGFSILNLENIMLKVYSNNPRAIRCYEKAGFKVIGKRRNARTLAGKKFDEVYMDIIKGDFTSPYIAGVVLKAGNENKNRLGFME